MKIIYSISNWIYGEEPLEKQFQRLKKFGYDAIELMVTEPTQFDLVQAKKLMDTYALACSSICTMMTGAEKKAKRRNLIDTDEDVIKRTLNYLQACLSIGEELDAPLVLCVPSGVANISDGWTKENRERCVEALSILGDHATSVGKILLAIEPINRYENAFLQRCDQALELLEMTNHPRIKMMLDFFHTSIEEDNNGDAIRRAHDKAIHFHVADSNRKSTGRGQTDWFEIFRALRDINYNGALACEPLPPTGADVYESLKGVRPEADLYAQECIEYLKFIEKIIVPPSF
ncbi:MAG: sugar phosphate isomerase/epimerase family protein [Candidatus Helarchaeota archaeon]